MYPGGLIVILSYAMNVYFADLGNILSTEDGLSITTEDDVELLT